MYIRTTILQSLTNCYYLKITMCSVPPMSCQSISSKFKFSKIKEHDHMHIIP